MRGAVPRPRPSEDGRGPGSLPSSPERTESQRHEGGEPGWQESEDRFHPARSRARRDAGAVSVLPTSGSARQNPSLAPDDARPIRGDGDPRWKPSMLTPRTERRSKAVRGRFRLRVSSARRAVSRPGGPFKFLRRTRSPELYPGTGLPRRSSMRSVDGRSLDLADVIAVARKGEPVRLAPVAAKPVAATRRALEKVVAKGTLAYGIKTGFGELANVAISDSDVRALQLNLLRSHAIGQGSPLRRDEVRAAILLRANTLAMGYSGVRRILVTRLLDFLNRGVHPVIPSRGSLGASGDLAPLAHMGLVLIGEGEAEVEGRVL